MTKIRLKYDGWLVLPATIRQKLGLATGDQLEVELSEGTILLRPMRQAGTAATTPAEPPPAEPSAPEPPLVAALAPLPKRGPGRPRKSPAAAAPPTLKVRGRRAAPPVVE